MTSYGPELAALFRHARRHVTVEDVERSVPGDPGSEGYVGRWKGILEDGTLPTHAKFSVTEVIALTCYGEAESESSQRGFRRFRILTSCVGVILLCTGSRASVCPANYLLIRLLEDLMALRDEVLAELLLPVLPQLRQSLDRLRDIEYPFCVLAELLLRLWGGEAAENLRPIADELIEAEAEARNLYPDGRAFLLGLTNFDTYHNRWRAIVAETLPADTSVESLALIRSAIVEAGP